MPASTRSSYAETNWAAAAAEATAHAVPSRNDDFPTQREEEDEDWVNTDVHHDGDDVEDENHSLRHESTGNINRSTWILQVAIPCSTTNSDNDGWIMSNIFVDSRMTAERLGQCIIQATSSASSNDPHQSSFDCNGSGLVGLFGKENGVFYSLEFILAMNPSDRRTFCVKPPPFRSEGSKTNGAVKDYSTLIFSHVTVGNLLLAAALVFLSILISPVVVDGIGNWNDYIYTFLMLIPKDIPSMWRMVSLALDWPAREIYRYGPVIGWEGRALIDICAEMNRQYYYVGLGRGINEDREYWRQNPEACLTIYRMKEESFARMCRPIWYLAILVGIFMAVQRFVDAFNKDPGIQINRTEKAVLDTYRALQILVREESRSNRRKE